MTWVTFKSGVAKSQLREVIRELRDLGYSDQVSIFIERKDPSTPSAAELAALVDPVTAAAYERASEGERPGLRRVRRVNTPFA